MKKRLSWLLGCLYVLGAAYYGSASAYGLIKSSADIRGSITLLVAAVWVGLGGLGLALGRREGWWSLVAFLLIASGGHLNRLFAQSPVIADLEHIEPLLWSVAHLTLLAWLRDRRGEPHVNPMPRLGAA